MKYKVYQGNTLKTTVTAKKATIKGLTPSTSYSFGVIPNNGLKDGAKATLTVKTKGPTVTIKHGLGKGVSVAVSYYEYAIGTEPDGLGTAPTGLGGSDPETITPTAISYTDDSVAVELPLTWIPTGSPIKQSDCNYYLITGFRTLRFTISKK